MMYWMVHLARYLLVFFTLQFADCHKNSVCLCPFSLSVVLGGREIDGDRQNLTTTNQVITSTR